MATKKLDDALRKVWVEKVNEWLESIWGRSNSV